MLHLSLRKDLPNLKILKLINLKYKRAYVGSNVSKQFGRVEIPQEAFIGVLKISKEK